MAVDVDRIGVVLTAVVRPVRRPGVHVAPVGVLLQLRAAGAVAQELAERHGAVAARPADDGGALVVQIRADPPIGQDGGDDLVRNEGLARVAEARHLVLGGEPELLRNIIDGKVLGQVPVVRVDIWFR